LSLITLRGVNLSFGVQQLLDNVDLVIGSGEKTAIVGRNGEGKSTLLKIIAGDIAADSGEIIVRDGASISRLPQEVPQGHSEQTVFEVVAEGLSSQQAADVIALQNDAGNSSDADSWQLMARVNSIISRLQIEPEAQMAKLSGGQKRRVMLAQALVAEPQLLLLDEPTNHLDIDSILWLEKFLQQLPISILLVTHDRELIRKTANRIIDIDRGRVTSWQHNYDRFLTARQQALDAEETANAKFDKKLQQEETWIRQGIKARRTRNEGRVRALKKMRDERRARRSQSGTADIKLQTGERSGKVVFELEGVSFSHGEQSIVKNFSTTILRGDKVAIIGPNGSGKTTLIKLLLGDLQPNSGTVKQGSNLEIAYFDQLRASLNENLNAADNVSDGADFIDAFGKRTHIMGYMQSFLFSPERARAPITRLSGGERNRLLLAKLFTKPANLLVLDEPTNDLDVESLELLESTIVEFDGTVLLVSHDRNFVDNIATSTIVTSTTGSVREYVGGYRDYLEQSQHDTVKTAQKQSSDKAAKNKSTDKQSSKKLSYKLQRELDSLPAKIEKLEEKKDAMAVTLADPATYKLPAEEQRDLQDSFSEMDRELDAAYARWEELEAQQ